MPKDVVAYLKASAIVTSLANFCDVYKHNSLICRGLMDQEEQLSEVLTDKNVRT